MPSGNVQRSVQNFISAVITPDSGASDVAPADVSSPRGTIRTSRRTIGNGSWIVNDLQSAHQQLQQALQMPMDSMYSNSMFQIHPRQSAAAETDIEHQTSQPQILSPRNVQAGSNYIETSEIIEGYMDSDTDMDSNSSSVSGQFDVTDLNNAGVPLQQLHQILRGASAIQNSLGIHPSVTSSRPAPINNSLRNKIVYKLNCTYCKIPVCDRAMRAILLADTKVELYSTDIPPKALVTMNEDRMTSGCNCRIRDTVCSGCGNVLGYHVSQPCDRCLDARNNGHFWMFCSEGITSSERMHFDGNGPLYWASLPPMCDFVPASSYISAGQSGNSGYDSFCR